MLYSLTFKMTWQEFLNLKWKSHQLIKRTLTIPFPFKTNSYDERLRNYERKKREDTSNLHTLTVSVRVHGDCLSTRLYETNYYAV